MLLFMRTSFLAVENSMVHSDMVHLVMTNYCSKRNWDDFFNLDCMYWDGDYFAVI